MPKFVHRLRKIGDVTRKPAGVGAEREVEDMEGKRDKAPNSKHQNTNKFKIQISKFKTDGPFYSDFLRIELKMLTNSTDSWMRSQRCFSIDACSPVSNNLR
jgi:hypothetical protein